MGLVSRILCALAICTLGVVAGAAALHAASRSNATRVVIGRSVQGRAIVAVRVGDPDSPRNALVVGSIHGDEPAGTAVTRRILRRFRDIGGVDLWVVKTVNPDGIAAHTRRNAHGVDLNRNFSYRWRPGSPASDYYPGPRPFSEPESRAVRRLVREIQPRVSIWFHQPWNQVLAPCRGDASLQRRFSALSGIPLKRCRGARLPGTAIGWQNHTFPGTTAFVVELPAGRISGRAARRDARAVVEVARHGAGPRSRGVTPAAWRFLPRIEGKMRPNRRLADVSLRATASALPRPPIHRRLIPFPPRRKREMSRYSKRHYGKPGWRLRNPHVIVEHIAVAGSLDAIYSTFAPDRPDPELGELPNVCSHFAVGSNGQIDQFVPLDIRCRHTVGLNYTAIGIEHVGFRDADVLGNSRQLRASLRLTQYLRCRFGIKVRNVIGHSESLSSPYHLELVPSLRHQTHGDWKHASMQVYRSKLRRLGPC
jgi:N-acetylmuramoyl-L-alanine amidase